MVKWMHPHSTMPLVRIGLVVVMFMLGHLALMTIPPATAAESDAHSPIVVEQCDAANQNVSVAGQLPGIPQIAPAAGAVCAISPHHLVATLLDSIAPAPDPTATRVSWQLFLN